MKPNNKGGRPPWDTKKLKKTNIETKANKWQHVGLSRREHKKWEDAVIESNRFNIKVDYWPNTINTTHAYSNPPLNTTHKSTPNKTTNRYTQKIQWRQARRKQKQALT